MPSGSAGWGELTTVGRQEGKPSPGISLIYIKDNSEDGFNPILAASIISIADVFLIGNYLESKKRKNKRARFVIPSIVLVLTAAFFVLVNM